MVSEHIQSLRSIGPVDEIVDRQKKEEQDPARSDYLQGREHFTAGEYGKAAVSFHNALKGFEEQGDTQGVANAADRLGDVCLAREEYSMALENFQRAHAICRKEEDSFSTLSLNKKMAAAYKKLGQMENALELLYDMLEHFQLTRNPKGLVDILVVIAEVYIEQGNTAGAADAYRTAASIHKNFKHKRLAEDFARRAEELEQA